MVRTTGFDLVDFSSILNTLAITLTFGDDFLRKYNYDKDVLANLVAKSNSISEVARGLGMQLRGGNLSTLHKKIEEYGLDTSHFLGRAWSRNKSFIKTPINDYLNNTKPIPSYKLKNRLFKEHLKENVCELCGISEWNGQYIACQLHHKDGNCHNNSLDNLQILCPNCHSQTDSFAGKNLRKPRLSVKINKFESKPRLSTRCVVRPSYEQFQKEFADLNYNFCAMARKYGVSDNAIRKWIRSYKKYGI